LMAAVLGFGAVTWLTINPLQELVPEDLPGRTQAPLPVLN